MFTKIAFSIFYVCTFVHYKSLYRPSDSDETFVIYYGYVWKRFYVPSIHPRDPSAPFIQFIMETPENVSVYQIATITIIVEI